MRSELSNMQRRKNKRAHNPGPKGAALSMPPIGGFTAESQGSLSRKNPPCPPLQRGVLTEFLIIETRQTIPPPFIKGDRGGFDGGSSINTISALTPTPFGTGIASPT
jgi:hypothetical protein